MRAIFTPFRFIRCNPHAIQSNWEQIVRHSKNWEQPQRHSINREQPRRHSNSLSNLQAIQIHWERPRRRSNSLRATSAPFKFVASNLYTIQIHWEQPVHYLNSLRATSTPFKFIESKLHAIQIHWQRPTSVAVTTGSSGQVVENIYPGLFVCKDWHIPRVKKKFSVLFKNYGSTFNNVGCSQWMQWSCMVWMLLLMIHTIYFYSSSLTNQKCVHSF